jgi:hypothetical protein
VRVSWVPPRSSVPIDSLDQFDLKTFRQACLKSLQRVLPTQSVLVGGIDVSLNVQANANPRWRFHVYALAAVSRGAGGSNARSAMEALRRLPAGEVPRPIKLALLSSGGDLPRVISYSVKAEFYRRSRYFYVRASGRPSCNTRAQALPVHRACELALLLDRTSLAARLLLIGVRRYGPLGNWTLRPTARLSSSHGGT